MRKIVAGLFISFDGVVESPDKWHFPYFNDEMGAVVGSQMANSDAMLLGRQTYEEFAGFWPKQTGDEWPGPYMNSTRKYVVSSTLKTLDWQNSTLIDGDANAQIQALKEQPGKDIAITGSGTLVRTLMADGLIDELSLLVHPIVVGAGKRLFENSPTIPMKLVEAKTFSTGVQHLRYAPAD